MPHGNLKPVIMCRFHIWLALLGGQRLSIQQIVMGLNAAEISRQSVPLANPPPRDAVFPRSAILCKAKRQYLHTCKVSRYRIFALVHCNPPTPFKLYVQLKSEKYSHILLFIPANVRY